MNYISYRSDLVFADSAGVVIGSGYPQQLTDDVTGDRYTRALVYVFGADDNALCAASRRRRSLPGS